MEQDNKRYIQLKQIMMDLLESLKRVDSCNFSRSEKEVWEVVLSKTKVFLEQLEQFVFSIAGDLAKTRQELKKNSNKLLVEATEQLDKVSESTQKVAHSVMDRIDRICEKQNGVFEQLNQIKEKVESLGSEATAGALLDDAGRIEALESEIQMEAFEIMNEMQFQDITTQQLQQANNLIGEAENKLMNFGHLLSALSGEKSQTAGDRSTKLGFDPKATLDDSEKRQALADEITTKFEKKK